MPFVGRPWPSDIHREAALGTAPSPKACRVFAFGAIVIVTLLVAYTAMPGEAASAIPWEPAQAHAYADQVLQPRFVSAMNEWTHHHPKDRPGHEWEHCEQLDAGDVVRWQLARKAFRDLDRAYKRAGY